MVATGDAVGAAAGTFDGRNGVAVLDLQSGKELWTAKPTDDLVGYFGAAPGNRVVVAAEGSCAEFLGVQRLVAFDAATGRRRWSTPGGGFALRSSHPLSTYFNAAVPVDAAGVVVVSTEEATIGYRARDGHAVWSKPADADAPRAVTNDLVITAARQSDPVHTFRALDRRTGRVRWESDGWTDRFDIIAASKRHVVVATGGLGSQPYPGPVTLVVLDARTGAEEGRFDGGEPELFYFNDVAIRDGLLVYAQGSSVTARRLPHGEHDWSRRFVARGSLEGLARSTDDATVFALGSGTKPRVTALDAATGRARWSSTTGWFRTATSTTTIVADAHPGRTLAGIDTNSGARTWRYEVPAALSPSGLGAGDLAVAAAGGRLAISNPCDTG